jgi:hypothetical protein
VTTNGFPTPDQALYRGASRKPLAWVTSDPTHPGMFRVRLPDGRRSGMLNLTRAKDAAAAIAERGPPRRDPRGLHWEQDHHESTSAARGRISDRTPYPGSTPPNSVAIFALADRMGLSVNQVESGIEIAKSGRTDVLAAVIAGRITVLEALAAVRRKGVG